MKVIYLDMDGVLADLEKGLYEMDGFVSSTGGRDALFKRELPKYVSKDGFYTSPVMPNADALVNYLLQFTKYNKHVKLAILTSAGNFYNPVSEVVSQKKRWIEKNFSDLSNIPFCATTSGADKCFLAHKDAFLIDDHEPNVTKFEAQGGFGFIYEDSLSINLVGKLQTFLCT